MNLQSQVSQQHDAPTRRTSAFLELVQLVLFLVMVEQNVSSREHEESAGLGTVGKEQAPSSLDIGRLGVADGDTKGSGKVLVEVGGRVGGGRQG